MTDKHTRLIEISADDENSVESFLNNVRKQASEGQRYGVNIKIRRVDKSEIEGLEGGFE